MTSQDDVKVTVVIARDLWKRTKIQAIREDRDLRELVIEALERYLAAKEKKGTHGSG
jgi:hypothetical protein